VCAYESVFVIVGGQGCPLYSKDERFTLSGLTLSGPVNRPSCILLVQDIIESVIKNMDKAASDTGRDQEKIFFCSGCSGNFIKLAQRLKNKNQSLQAQVLEKMERLEQFKATSDLADLLNTFSFFHDLDKQSVQDIIAVMKADSFKEGEVILTQGRQGKNLYIIVAGKVAVIDAKGIVINSLGKGEIFGEMSLLSGNKTNATVKAVEPLTALVLSRKDINSLLIKHPNLQETFTRLIIQRLYSADAKKVNVHTAGITGRLNELPASELFQMFHENGKTGLIEMILSKGKALVEFVKGEIVRAEYHNLTGQEAFFDILREADGQFRFISSPPPEKMPKAPIGTFMKILMEGLRLLDEEKASPEDFIE